ncbi:MAG: peptide-methionine (S)-S-oxide reductase MsrA, partial [Myxococcota bacterium]
LKGGTVAATPVEDGFEVATFAGGCFWCMEPPFDEVEGVKSTTSGYTGGPELHPSYKQVAYGRTGHTESIRVVFDPKVVGYDKLLEVFWRNVNPTDAGGQFVDRGKQYRPAVFVHSDAQKKAAEASKQALQASGKFDSKIIVPIQTAGEFWVAEDYHQDFYKKSPARYYGYRRGSGRDQFIARVWGTSK